MYAEDHVNVARFRQTMNGDGNGNGVYKIENLMKDSCSYLSYNDFINTYKIQINPLKYYGIISALKHLYNHTNRPNEPDDSATPEPFLELFLNSLKGNRVVYKKLASFKGTVPINSQTKWNNTISLELDNDTDADWRTAYILAPRCTKSTMLINFQYRLLHRILPTNMFLIKIGIKQDPNCSFCNISIGNLTHLFWQCEKIKLFWQNLNYHLQKISINTTELSQKYGCISGT